MQENRERMLAEKKRLAEKAKEIMSQKTVAQQSPIPPATENININETHLKALQEAAQNAHLLLHDGNLGAPTLLNRPTLELLNLFFDTLHNRKSTVVLQWPFSPRESSFLHPLAMIATICASDKKNISDGYAWYEACNDFRTLYFPWRGPGNRGGQRNLLIRRHEVLKANGFHLTRKVVKKPESLREMGYLHDTWGHLDLLSKRDKLQAHLAHPNLAEIYPLFVADRIGTTSVPFQEPAGELFGRVKHGAKIEQLVDNREKINKPQAAPFAMFAISPNSNWQRALASEYLSSSKGGRAPHICFLDFGAPAMNKLGHDWESITERFVKDTLKRFPNLPFFAVTHDPYVYRKLQFLLKDGGKPKTGVVIRATSDAISPDTPINCSTSLISEFHAISGDVSAAIMKLSEASRVLSDRSLAGSLRRTIGNIRKAASLPCGLGYAYLKLTERFGQDHAELFLEKRTRTPIMKVIDQILETGISGRERQLVEEAKAAVTQVYNGLDRETPIGSLFVEVAEKIARKSSKSIIAFSDDDECFLAATRLSEKENIAEVIKRRLNEKFILIVNRENLNSKLQEISKSGDKSWKRLILISPSQDFLSSLMIKDWLPDELVVLCDQTFCERVSSLYSNLAKYNEFSGNLSSRLTKVSEAAKAEAKARGVSTISLEITAPTTFNPADLTPDEDLIDLTDEDDDSEESYILFTMDSGRKIKARKRQLFIAYDMDAEVNPFERKHAKEVEIGMTVVVPSKDFLAEAQKILPARVLAQSYIRIYHSLIEASLPLIEGDSLNAKGKTILKKLKAKAGRTESHQTIVDWLNVEEHKQLPPEKLRPHAPQRWKEFNIFMTAISVPEELQEKIWSEGIEPLRIERRKAGIREAQALVSVLVDYHGTSYKLSPEIRERISTLRARAFDYIERVVQKEESSTDDE